MTVRELMLELANYPPDAEVYAYEGEDTGIAVIDKEGELGFISTRPFPPEVS